MAKGTDEIQAVRAHLSQRGYPLQIDKDASGIRPFPAGTLLGWLIVLSVGFIILTVLKGW